MQRYNTTTVIGVGLFHLGKRLLHIAKTGEYADELPEAAIIGSNIMDHGFGSAIILYAEELIFGEELSSTRFLADPFSQAHIDALNRKGFLVVTPAAHQVADLAAAAGMIGYTDHDVSKVVKYMSEVSDASDERVSILDAWNHVSKRFLTILGGDNQTFDEASSHDNTLRLSALMLQMIDPRGHFDAAVFKKIIHFEHYLPEIHEHYQSLPLDSDVRKFIDNRANGLEMYAQTLIVTSSTDVSVDDIINWKKNGMKRLGRDMMKRLKKNKNSQPLIQSSNA